MKLVSLEKAKAHLEMDHDEDDDLIEDYIEMASAAVINYLDGAVTSHDFGHPKEHAPFWTAACAHFGFDPARALFADDNSKMLDAARSAGVRWVYGVRHWDTRGSRREHVDHESVDRVADL